MRGADAARAARRSTNRRSYWVYLFARLKPGVSIEQARAALNVPYRAILNDVEAPLQKGMSDADDGALQRQGDRRSTPGAARPELACTAKRARRCCCCSASPASCCSSPAPTSPTCCSRAAPARAGEMAVRLSIGASRRQLVAPAADRVVLLAVLGGLAGLLVVALDARWHRRAAAGRGRCDDSASALDCRRCSSPAALALGTGLLFGLFPALHSTRPDLVVDAQGQARASRRGARAAARFRATLATAQIALVDGAARRRPGSSSGASSTSAASISASSTEQRRHVRRLAGAERLHAGAVARALRARRGRARARCRA